MDRGHGGRGERSPEVKRMRILLGEGFLSLYIGHMVSAGRMNPGLHPGLRRSTRFGVLEQALLTVFSFSQNPQTGYIYLVLIPICSLIPQ